MDTQERRKQLQLQKIAKRREEKRKARFRRKMLSIFTVAAICTVSVGAVYSASAKEVTITEINEFNGTNQTVTLKTRVDNVEQALEEHGVDVSESDKINVPVDSELDKTNNIVITRGKQVTIKNGDAEEVVTVTKADTTDALVEAGYIPGEYDEISSNGQSVADSDTIEIVSVSYEEEKQVTPIEFSVEYIDDPSIPKGETRVVTEGSAGEKTTVYNVEYRNNIEVSRNIVSESVTKEPVNKVIANGTKEPVKTVTAPSSTPTSSVDSGNTINGMKYKKKITMTATAYSTSPSENGGYTVSAMGNSLGYGIVAIDPSIVPLGSKVYVESTDGTWTYGVASAEDTGGAIKGNRIDLCYEGSVASVNTFGRRSCNVYILE